MQAADSRCCPIGCGREGYNADGRASSRLGEQAVVSERMVVARAPLCLRREIEIEILSTHLGLTWPEIVEHVPVEDTGKD